MNLPFVSIDYESPKEGINSSRLFYRIKRMVRARYNHLLRDVFVSLEMQAESWTIMIFIDLRGI